MIKQEQWNRPSLENNSELVPKTFLVPVDFSEVSKNAVEYAFQMAEYIDAKIILLHLCYETPVDTSFVPEEIVNMLREGHQSNTQVEFDKLLEATKDLSFRPVKVETVVKFGTAAQGIIQASEEYKADVIIMGTMGADSMSEKITGSITAKVIEGANCPVLAIPLEVIFQPIKHIMYAMQLSGEDHHAIDQLLEVSDWLGATLHCTHIRTEDKYWDQIEMDVVKKIYELEENNKRIDFYIVSDSDVVAGLQHFINHHQINMIAMLTHKDFMIQRVYPESFTRKMAMHTDIPLLALHQSVPAPENAKTE